MRFGLRRVRCARTAGNAPVVRNAGPGPVLAISCRKLALTAFKLAEDIAVAAVVHIVRHPPYVDRPGEAEYADVNSGGVRETGVAAPVAPMAEASDAADVDIHAFRHIDVDIAERRENGHRSLPAIDRCFTQIQVEIPESAGGDCLPAQSQPATSPDMAEQGRRETGGLAARTGCCQEELGQIFPGTRQLPAGPGPQGCFDSLGEFLKGQPAGEKVLAKYDDSLITVGV
jgi:hypothetical protein